jgi:dihydrofolate synthase/folylpolyglutamate synthase
VAQHQHNFEEIEPSFFEMTVALAFDAFARHEVDIAIIEVGLGGRLDSTNIITPLLSIITNIGWDHMNLLGNTLTEIATEKAGIIKQSIPVIIGEYQEKVASVFTNKAAEENTLLIFASEQWVIDRQYIEENGQRTNEPNKAFLNLSIHAASKKPATDNLTQIFNFSLDLTGTYQLKNAKTVFSAVHELRRQGFTITNQHIADALQQVQLLTGLAGRWQTLSTSPLTICDTGHNPDGILEVLKNIAAVPYQHLHFVLGMVNDKDITKVLSLLPQDATYYFCRPDIPRGLTATELQQQAATMNLKGQTYPTVPAALAAAQQAAQPQDLVFAGGSTFVVAEIV